MAVLAVAAPITAKKSHAVTTTHLCRMENAATLRIVSCRSVSVGIAATAGKPCPARISIAGPSLPEPYIRLAAFRSSSRPRPSLRTGALLRRSGEGDYGPGAAALGLGEDDRRAVRRRDLPGDRQAQAGRAVGVPAAGVKADEPAEDPLALGRGDARAVVDHLDDERVRRLGADQHLAPGVADRVVGQVAEHPGQLVRVSADGRPLRNGDVDADAR